MKKILLAIAALLVLGTTGLVIAVAVRQHRTFDAPYPDIHASSDPAVIARGRYLALGPAHCVDCHGDPATRDHTDEPAFSGGETWSLPIGKVHARNITPDRETGIGRYTDPEIARVLRYGVHPSGRAMIPFMPFANMTDEDLTAVISYLRSRPPVRHEVSDPEPNLLGRFARAFILEPRGPDGPIAPRRQPEPTAEYGAYLANSVGNCAGCHTKRSLRTGAALGEPFAGGMELETKSGAKIVSVNLTPDPQSGHIYAWSEDVFVNRFKYAVATDSPMPWRSFRTMSETDLRAIYRYLRTLPPVLTAQRSQ